MYTDGVEVPSADVEYLEKSITKDIENVIQVLKDEYGQDFSESTYRELFILIQDFSSRVARILAAEAKSEEKEREITVKTLDQTQYLGAI